MTYDLSGRCSTRPSYAPGVIGGSAGSAGLEPATLRLTTVCATTAPRPRWVSWLVSLSLLMLRDAFCW